MGAKNLLARALVVALSAAMAALLGMTPPLKSWDDFIYDVSLVYWAGGSFGQAPVAVALIDDRSLKTFKKPPALWGAQWAAAISNLSQAGASVVAVTAVHSVSLEEILPSLDEKLAAAIRGAEERGTRVLLGYSERTGVLELPHPKFLNVAAGKAMLDLHPGGGGTVREYLPCHTHGDGSMEPSMALAAAYLLETGAENLEGMDKYRPDMCAGKGRMVPIDYRREPEPGSIFSFADLAGAMDGAAMARLGEKTRGKAVFIGAGSARSGEYRKVPFNPVETASRMAPETLIHALALETLLSPASIRSGGFSDGLKAAAVLGAAVSILILSISPAWAIMAAAALMAGWTGWALLAMGGNMAVETWPPAAGILGAFPVSGLYIYVTEYRLRRQLERHFKSYVNEEVMDRIIRAPGSVDFKGRLVHATVMFSDIRSFTAISEKLEPHQVVAGLNVYFTEMTGAITKSGGYVSKYMGDGIMAIFGAPEYNPRDGALAAAWAAVKMLNAAGELNKKGIFPGFPEIKMGIGIHCGMAIVGDIGCDRKMEYTVIGDTVNTAARIEGLTKDYQIPLLLSESVVECLGGQVEAEHLGASLVRGKEKHINVYTLKSYLAPPQPPHAGEPEKKQEPKPVEEDEENDYTPPW